MILSFVFRFWFGTVGDLFYTSCQPTEVPSLKRTSHNPNIFVDCFLGEFHLGHHFWFHDASELYPFLGRDHRGTAASSHLQLDLLGVRTLQ